MLDRFATIVTFDVEFGSRGALAPEMASVEALAVLKGGTGFPLSLSVANIPIVKPQLKPKLQSFSPAKKCSPNIPKRLT